MLQGVYFKIRSAAVLGRSDNRREWITRDFQTTWLEEIAAPGDGRTPNAFGKRAIIAHMGICDLGKIRADAEHCGRPQGLAVCKNLTKGAEDRDEFCGSLSGLEQAHLREKPGSGWIQPGSPSSPHQSPPANPAGPARRSRSR